MKKTKREQPILGPLTKKVAFQEMDFLDGGTPFLKMNMYLPQNNKKGSVSKAFQQQFDVESNDLWLINSWYSSRYKRTDHQEHYARARLFETSWSMNIATGLIGRKKIGHLKLNISLIQAPHHLNLFNKSNFEALVDFCLYYEYGPGNWQYSINCGLDWAYKRIHKLPWLRLRCDKTNKYSGKNHCYIDTKYSTPLSKQQCIDFTFSLVLDEHEDEIPHIREHAKQVMESIMGSTQLNWSEDFLKQNSSALEQYKKKPGTQKRGVTTWYEKALRSRSDIEGDFKLGVRAGYDDSNKLEDLANLSLATLDQACRNVRVPQASIKDDPVIMEMLREHAALTKEMHKTIESHRAKLIVRG